MFRKRSKARIRDIEDGERFARTAMLTFLLVYIAFPIFQFSNQGVDTDPSGNFGSFIFLIWFFGLPLAAKMFFIGMIAGALAFFPVYRFLSSNLGMKFAAIIAASGAAYFAVLVSYHIKVGFSPFGISWKSEYGAYDFSRSLGIFAAVISGPIAGVMWIGADAHD